MASSGLENELDAVIKKIDAGLSLWYECRVDDPLENPSNSEIISWKEMLITFRKHPRSTFMRLEGGYLSDYPFPGEFLRSTILHDSKMCEAAIFSKIFWNQLEFDLHRHEYKGQLVWVTVEEKLMLVSQNQIIYSVDRMNMEIIRKSVNSNWRLLKDKVRNNFIKAFSTPESMKDLSKYGSNLQSSSDAKVTNKTSSLPECTEQSNGSVSKSQSSLDVPLTSIVPAIFGNQVSYPITDEIKKLMLDELNSFNLDPRIKQKFLFDLDMLPDKDVCYWSDRLDSLRFYSICSPASSQDSELQRLSQLVVKLEKMTQDTATLLASIEHNPKTTASETVSKFKNVTSKAQKRTWDDTLSNLSEAVLLQDVYSKNTNTSSKTMNEEPKVNGEKLQKLIETVSTLAEAVLAMKTTVFKLEETIKPSGACPPSCESIASSASTANVINLTWDM